MRSEGIKHAYNSERALEMVYLSWLMQRSHC